MRTRCECIGSTNGNESKQKTSSSNDPLLDTSWGVKTKFCFNCSFSRMRPQEAKIRYEAKAGTAGKVSASRVNVYKHSLDYCCSCRTLINACDSKLRSIHCWDDVQLSAARSSSPTILLATPSFCDAKVLVAKFCN